MSPNRDTLDASCNIVSELRYSPWGETRYNSGSTPTRYQYTGQYSYTPDFGLYFYNARWYDPTLGRFTQPDSLIPEQSQGAQAWDRYAYVNNNPLRYTDPSGHWLETAWDILNIAWDLYEVRRDPSLLNIGALVVDVGAAVLPFVPAGVGMVVRGGKAAKAAVEIASHADEVVDVGKLGTKAAEELKAVELVENASDALRGVNPAVIGEVSERGAGQAARGGTYKLIDPVTGEVQYVGRTRDLARRQAEHRCDPLKEQFRFEIDWRTDDYTVQRGREQMLYDQYRPPLNRIRPISPRNPRLQAYLEAAKRFGERMR
jgi:RHS repeat-associated protein